MLRLLHPDIKGLQPHQERFAHICHLVTIIVGFIHSSFIGIFILIGVLELAYFNVFSCLLFFCSWLFIRRGKIYLGAFLNIVEVIIHQFLCVYFLGQEFGFQYYLMAIAPFVFFVPTDDIRFPNKLLAGMIIIILAATLVVYGNMNKPIYDLVDQTITPIIGFINATLSLMMANITLVIFVRATYRSEKALEFEIHKSEELLHNILPTSIASRLKESSTTIADGYPNASVLFADVVGFTELSQRIEPAALVKLLNKIFSEFDDLVDQYKLEKIKTIGDAYMVAAGIPTSRSDHAPAMADFALAMRKAVNSAHIAGTEKIRIRIGINSGPVVAGVIGKKKFIYDLWGDTVNTAARMESHGVIDEIQITEDSYQLLKDQFHCEERGSVSIKGKGDMKVYLLRDRIEN